MIVCFHAQIMRFRLIFKKMHAILVNVCLQNFRFVSDTWLLGVYPAYNDRILEISVDHFVGMGARHRNSCAISGRTIYIFLGVHHRTCALSHDKSHCAGTIDRLCS